MPGLYEKETFIYNRVPIKVFNHHFEGETIFTPLHWHRNVEFNLTTGGRIRRSVDGKMEDYYPGHWNIVNSGELHTDRWIGKDDLFEGITLQISKPFMDYWLGENIILKVPEEEAPNDQIIGLFHRFGNLRKETENYGLEAMELLFGFMLLLKNFCIDNDAKAEPRRENAISGIKKIINYIDEHYREDISLGSVAEDFHYTPAHLSRMFKEHIGQNFHEYVQTVRLLNCVDRMKKNQNMKLTDCAMENGFANVKSFIVTFKKYFGCTPSEWLKKRK